MTLNQHQIGVMRERDPGDSGWWTLAACKGSDPETWHPEQGKVPHALRRICWEECSVREACLDYALRNCEKFGVWGGHSEKERKRLRRCGAVPCPVKPLPAHGTVARYNRTCRCDLCRKAKADYMRVRYRPARKLRKEHPVPTLPLSCAMAPDCQQVAEPGDVLCTTHRRVYEAPMPTTLTKRDEAVMVRVVVGRASLQEAS